RLGHQVPPGHAPLGGDRRNRGREDEEEEVIQAVTHVQQEARRARVRHVTKPKACPQCPACYSGPKIVEKRTWPRHPGPAPDRPTLPTTSGCPPLWPPWPRTFP